ncbi:MAG TPA: hypothetical protein VFZ70_09425 [Euzebyales bacterium]
MSGYRRTTALLVAALGVGVAVASMLGPLVFDVLRYRTSDTTLNQVMGGDLAGLVVVAPTALAAGVLLWRGHRAGPVVALAPALWAVYMYAQLIVGQEYLQLPGNNERFFPLLLTRSSAASRGDRVADRAPVRAAVHHTATRGRRRRHRPAASPSRKVPAIPGRSPRSPSC